MLDAIWGWVKGLFGGKGAIQVGSGNQSVTGTTSGDNSPVVAAGRDFHVQVVYPQQQSPEREALTNLAEPVQKFLAELAETMVQHPLLRDIIVLRTKSIAYNWPGPHLKFSEDETPDIREIIKILENNHLLIEQKDEFAYRLGEPLVKLLGDLNKYKIHDTLLKMLRSKGAIICPWEQLLPEVDRSTLMAVIALLRDEGLAEITVGGHAVPPNAGPGGFGPSIDEIMKFGPAFNGRLTDKGTRAVDEFKENIVCQFLAAKER